MTYNAREPGRAPGGIARLLCCASRDRLAYHRTRCRRRRRCAPSASKVDGTAVTPLDPVMLRVAHRATAAGRRFCRECIRGRSGAYLTARVISQSKTRAGRGPVAKHLPPPLFLAASPSSSTRTRPAR